MKILNEWKKKKERKEVKIRRKWRKELKEKYRNERFWMKIENKFE